MAEASPAAANAELLEWPKKDKRRLLHAVYRVGDLDRTIKFYTECFGMKLLRKRDVPEEKYSNAFLGFGPEQSHFVVELTYNYGVTSYDIGTGFGHFAIATEDALGMKLLRTVDKPEYKYTLAMLGYAEEDQTTVLELTYNYGVTEYTKGNAYAQVAISTDDVYKSAEVVNLVTQELGGKITRQPGSIPGLNTKITSFVDPDGWKTVLVDNEDFLKEIQSE
ncbi:Lactoylglutathione lyase GLX1 [Citrus sinensis]|nr:Lactoylglutathione lyase GLX1 [Citrus sinensis]